MMRVAVIGAGLAGLTAASRLSSQHEVTVFDKSRGVGGRMATRRAEPYVFDHGAPFFTARSESFKAFLEPMLASGVVKRWDTRFAEFDGNGFNSPRDWGERFPHYVGCPNMTSLAKHLAKNVDCRLQAEVSRVCYESGWTLFDSSGSPIGKYDWLVMAIPQQQACALLRDYPPVTEAIQGRELSACMTLMLGLAAPFTFDYGAILVRNHDISWISLNHTKPDRPDVPMLVVHATNQWASRNLDKSEEFVRMHMRSELEKVVNLRADQVVHESLHRWRYANIVPKGQSLFFSNPSHQLLVCGDWFSRAIVESAFTSGYQAASFLL